MKTAKRVLAILMAMLMAVSVFAVAASAAGALQTKIDNAAAGDTVSIATNTKESVTITKDLTLDLGGRILKSVEGKSAITVKNGAKVTIQNGYVESLYTAYSGATRETLEILGKIGYAPAGITAYGSGTEVTLNDVRVLGGLVRIPKTTEWFVPAGSALKLYGGAKAELNNAVLVGSYAISNDPAKTGRADGIVTVNDALLFGYIDYIKVAAGLVYDQATVEKVNAANRIIGVLNDNVHLESYELDVLKTVMDDRVYIFTTKPTDTDAVVTIDKTGAEPVATITAAQIKDLKTTDCSYKYVPENAYDVATGKTFPLDTEIPASEVIGKEIRINYRLDFQLKGDFKKIADKILAGQFDSLYNTYYNKAVQKADAAYAQGIEKALDFYDAKIQQFADIYETVAEAGQASITVNNVTYNAANELGDDYYAILRGLLSIGGVTMYNKTEKGMEEPFNTRKLGANSALYKYGEKAPTLTEEDLGTYHWDVDYVNGQWVDDSYYDVINLGTLDQVEALKNEFLALKGDASLGDQSKWNAYAHFVINNYQKVLDIVADAAEKVDELYTLFTDKSQKIGQIVDGLNMTNELKLLKDIKKALNDVNGYIDVALGNEIVADVKARIDRNADNGTVEKYMAKVKNAINNPREYVTPEDLVKTDEDGTLLETYRVTGPTRVEVIEKGKLNIKVLGAGDVAYTSDIANVNGTWSSTNFTGLAYNNAITLTATPKAGAEFMYYVISDTQHIYSTNPVCVVDTQAASYIEAVFEDASKAKVVFTNNTGVISEVLDYSASIDASSVEEPGTPGFELVGWGPNGNKTLTSADFTSAYKVGNSAFEGGAVYTIKGFGFKLNSITSNKYLITSKLDSKTVLKINFHDDANADGVFGSDEVPFGKTITYTAQGDNFSYWVDEDETIVSVYPTYTVEAIKDVELTAVYNKDAASIPDALINIPHYVYEDSRVLVYAERSVAASRDVVSTGFLISFVDAISTEEQLNFDTVTVDRVNVFKTVSTTKERQGVSSVGLSYATMNRDGHDGVAYIRAFVELKTATGTEFVYSPVEMYEG